MQNEERINGLENQVRTLKRIVYGFGCLLVAGVVVSATSMQTVPDVIQANSFEITNDEGKVFSRFGVIEHGGSLDIFDNDGKRVVAIGAGGLDIIGSTVAGFGQHRSQRINGKDEMIFRSTKGIRIMINHDEGDSDKKMEVFRDGNNTWTYQVFNVRGWKLLVEQSHLGDTKLIKDIRSTLEQRLAHIENVIPKQQVAFLKTIPIWVSDEPTYPLRPGENGAIPFHRSEEWLRDHGLNPHMAPGVHFINPHPIMYEHKMFESAPETMLHELAHAYHNLKLGLDQTDIRRAYDGAMARGLYQDVPSRSDPGKLVKAFAATNHEEYFAEITEAYFGQNDWFPYNRQELFEYDPKGYKVVERVWGITSD